jgi:hypothetical protein
LNTCSAWANAAVEARRAATAAAVEKYLVMKVPPCCSGGLYACA